MKYILNVLEVLAGGVSLAFTSSWAVVIFIVLLVAGILVFRVRPARAWQFALLPLGSTLALAFWGAAFHRTRTEMPSVPAWQNLVTELLLFAFVPLAVVAVWKAKGSRPFAFLVTAIAGVPTYWCYFYAYMRVSGDWI